MKTPFWLAIWIIAFEAIVVTILVPGDWTASVIARESRLIQAHLGEREQAWVYAKATAWYNTSLINSGAYQTAHDYLIPSEEKKARSRGLETMGDDWFGWIGGRLMALANVYYQMLARFAFLLTWLPFLMVLMVPAVFDGISTWKIKRTNFAYSSPLLHQYSVKAIGAIVVILIGLFIAPMVLEPMIIPTTVMIVCVMLGLMMGNLQKRL